MEQKKAAKCSAQQQKKFLTVQWAPLNGIMDNGINEKIESNLSKFKSPKLLCYTSCKLELICL